MKQALQSVGQAMHDQRNINNLTPEENLAIFGRELLHDDTKKGDKGRKHPDFDFTEFHTAMTFLRGGTPADMRAGAVAAAVTAGRTIRYRQGAEDGGRQ